MTLFTIIEKLTEKKSCTASADSENDGLTSAACADQLSPNCHYSAIRNNDFQF